MSGEEGLNFITEQDKTPHLGIDGMLGDSIFHAKPHVGLQIPLQNNLPTINLLKL